MATVANRAIKARPKATPDRIQENISNAKAIKGQEIIDNDMVHIAESEELTVSDLPQGNISVPLNLWLDHTDEIKQRGGKIAVQIAADESAFDVAESIEGIEVIVLPFVGFVDGRSYTHAYHLRTRLGFKGEIRAVGDVHYDHLDFLARVGCDAFELPEGGDLVTALDAFKEFTEHYQPSADNAQLIFSRRRVKH